jgi:hypothetical protein
VTTYFKAVRPDGASFHDPTFRWLPADGIIPAGGWLVKHPRPASDLDPDTGVSASRYLSVATVPTECTGFQWPCRLLAVEPIGRTYKDDCYLPHKRRIRAGRVVAELPATDALGPQGVHVAALIERCGSLTADEMSRDAAWDAARDAAWDAAWAAARDATWAAAWDATRDAAWAAARDATWDATWAAARDATRDAAWAAARDATWDAAWDATRALLVRDVLAPEHYDTLTRPWRLVVGPCHPDDGPIS